MSPLAAVAAGLLIFVIGLFLAVTPAALTRVKEELRAEIHGAEASMEVRRKARETAKAMEPGAALYAMWELPGIFGSAWLAAWADPDAPNGYDEVSGWALTMRAGSRHARHAYESRRRQDLRPSSSSQGSDPGVPTGDPDDDPKSASAAQAATSKERP